MSTRFYLPSTGLPAQVTPFAPLWDSVYYYFRKLERVKLNSAATLVAPVKGGGNDRQVFVYTSESLEESTISGTAKLVISCAQTASLGAYLQMTLRVVDETGKVVRGTLFSGQTAVTTSANPADPNYILVTGTTIAGTRTRVLNVNLTSVDAQNGDRLELSIGYWHSYTGGFDRRGYFVIGDPTAGDVSDVVDANTGTLAPWLEFSQTLNFESEVDRVEEIHTSSFFSAGPLLNATFPSTVKERDTLFLFCSGVGDFFPMPTPAGWSVLYNNFVVAGLSSHNTWSAIFYKTATSDGTFIENLNSTFTAAAWTVIISVYRNAEVVTTEGLVSTASILHTVADESISIARSKGKILFFAVCGYSNVLWVHGGRLLDSEASDADRVSKLIEFSYDWNSPTSPIPNVAHLSAADNVGPHAQINAAVFIRYLAPIAVTPSGGNLRWRTPDDTWELVRVVNYE